MDIQELDFTALGLAEQQSEGTDSACAAYSLVNLLKIMGENVDAQSLDTLKRKATTQEPKGLTATQINEFLNNYGYDYKYLGYEFEKLSEDKNKFIEEFVNEVKEKPLSFTVSSALSMKKEPSSSNGVSNIGKHGVGHQVVAIYSNGKIRIVDPYMPNSGLFVFQETNPNSMGRLLSTITSRAAQFFLEQDSKLITRETVLGESLERLNSEDSASFIRAAVTSNNMYTAVEK